MILKAVIFDMDGVIVDSEPIWIASKQQMLKENGVEVPDSYHHRFFGTTLDYMWNAMKSEFDLPLTVEECIGRGEEIRRGMLKASPPKEIKGVKEFIQQLHQGGIPLAIASSSSKANIQQVTVELEIKEYFDVLVSSEECERSKPFPDVFLKAAEDLGVFPAECLIIEDAVNGVAAAKAAGSVCLGFANPNFTRQDLSLADGIFSDFADLTLEKCSSYF